MLCGQPRHWGRGGRNSFLEEEEVCDLGLEGQVRCQQDILGR